ncbi:MAG: c-type cytochrome biogenesis protein CcmI [Moraxellaceae bacterium]|nr:c-type cytochrome biogenesis protein CcmI [Moraxellaceae bacterium]
MSPVLTPLYLLALLLALIVVMAVIWPLRGRARSQSNSLQTLAARVYRERLDELNADHMASRIDADAYATLKLELDRGLLLDHARDEQRAVRPVQGVRMLALCLLLVVPAASLALYIFYFQSDEMVDDAERQARYSDVVAQVMAGQAPAADAPQPNLQDFVRVLQRRVQAEPLDADGWLSLGMAFMQARDFGPAQVALARAAEIKPNDLSVVLTYVQSTIVTQQGPMSPKIRGLLGKIMYEYPDHQGALLMHAMGSLRGGELLAARESLLRLQALRAELGEDPEADGQIARLLAETEMDADPQELADGFPVEITISSDLVANLPADAVLYVFARPLQGGGMPIAVVRRSIGQFPVRLVVSDADSLSPDRPLSGEPIVVLQARISLTGDATPSSGDLEAAAVPVRQDSRSLVRLRISEKRQ